MPWITIEYPPEPVRETPTAVVVASQLGLGAIVLLVVAMTYRRVREETTSRETPSRRSIELTRGSTPAHIVEHIARIGDPEYICLAIAENKLTVGPLLEKLGELAARSSKRGGGSTKGDHQLLPGHPGGDDEHHRQQRRASLATTISASFMNLNVAGDSTDIDSEESGRRGGTGSSGPLLSSQPLSSSGPARLATMGYGDVRGPLWVRQAVVDMMGECMFGREDVDPNNVVIAAGATSVLRLLVVALAERGQGCLIPGPYFPGFDKVLNVAEVKAWMVNRDPRKRKAGGGLEGGIDEGISPGVLQAALRRARAAGVEIRMLLITSPHNPTGRLYSPKALLAAVAWGRKRGLHIIVDEVYANCVHRPNASYRSVGNLLMGSGTDGIVGMGNDVHVLYGLSKDLGVAGWRVGVLYSENTEVVAMVSKMAHTSQASSDTMDLVGHLFREPGFLDEYFGQHQAGLRTAYMSLVNQLGRKGIMYLQAEAGLFVMLDLREFLETPSKEAEEKLWRQMLARTKVNLTPGGAFHCLEPGWFRLCFAYQPIDVVARAVDRIADFLEAVVHERTVASELDHLRQRQQQQQQHLQRRHQPPLLEAASAAIAAAFASTAAYASAAIRGMRSAAGAVKGKDRQEDEIRRSSAWGDRSGARRSGYGAKTPSREGFRRREKGVTGAGGSGSAGAVLYAISTVRTLRLQLKEKKKTNYNTAVQMHVGIVTFSVAAFIHSVCLVSPQPGMPALPLLLLLHLRHICVGYVTTVLVRHWAVLYQRMGKNQHTQGPLTERVSRFVGLYRDGEVIQAVATCSFFFGSVFYAVRNEDSWVRVERLQFLVWAILSGMTCWLVSILGQRVHAHMKSVARSRAVLDYLKRVKYVVIGSSFLWCQCTVCFSIGAAFDRPLSARAWLVVHGGIVLTSVGAGSLYYVVIGSKTADKAAHAVEAAGSPVEGVKQV
eukprot:g3951.t1